MLTSLLSGTFTEHYDNDFHTSIYYLSTVGDSHEKIIRLLVLYKSIYRYVCVCLCLYVYISM